MWIDFHKEKKINRMILWGSKEIIESGNKSIYKITGATENMNRETLGCSSNGKIWGY